MVPQLSFLSLKLNSSLKPLLSTLLWMILGIFLLLLHPLTTSSLKLKFFIMTFSMLSLALILGRLTVRMETLLLFSKTVLPSLLSTSTYPSCWKFAYNQPVPKKGDRSNPSNYLPTALIFCLSKAFKSVLNKKRIEELLKERGGSKYIFLMGWQEYAFFFGIHAYIVT